MLPMEINVSVHIFSKSLHQIIEKFNSREETILKKGKINDLIIFLSIEYKYSFRTVIFKNY